MFRKKYRESLPARFFLWRNRPLQPDGIWIHLCSFGEAKAVASLVKMLPQEQLRMSCITQTGFSQISKYTQQSRYLPFEPLLFLWLRRQRVLVVMEAELWYLLFALLKRRGSRIILINARISDRSLSRYRRFGWLYQKIFEQVDEIHAQSERDRDRLKALGAKSVRVTGNIKLSSLATVSRVWQKPAGLLVCAASTHAGEEQWILEAFAALKEQEPAARLVIAPRHPERFDEVAEIIKKCVHERSLSWERYAGRRMLQKDILLLDTLGELVNVYAIADLVILGGAFVPAGGHNAAEAAQFGCRIISGKHYFNQRELFSAIEGIAIVEVEALRERVLNYGTLEPSSIESRDSVAAIARSIEDAMKREE